MEKTINILKIKKAIDEVEELLDSNLTDEEQTVLNMSICLLAEKVVSKISG